MAKQPKKLYRNVDNKMVAGVCAGIAEYFNIDPVIVRLITLLLCFAGGSGVLAYIIAWIIVPPKPSVKGN